MAAAADPSTAGYAAGSEGAGVAAVHPSGTFRASVYAVVAELDSLPLQPLRDVNLAEGVLGPPTVAVGVAAATLASAIPLATVDYWDSSLDSCPDAGGSPVSIPWDS